MKLTASMKPAQATRTMYLLYIEIYRETMGIQAAHL